MNQSCEIHTCKELAKISKLSYGIWNEIITWPGSLRVAILAKR